MLGPTVDLLARLAEGGPALEPAIGTGLSEASGRGESQPLVRSASVAGTAAVTALGVPRWLSTVLQALSPCGENDPCRPADPDPADRAVQLRVLVPAPATVVGLAVEVGNLDRRRPAIVPTGIAFAVALAASPVARPLLLSALQDVVP